MQDALSIVPKLREENAALVREVAELRKKHNSLAKNAPASAHGGSLTRNRVVSSAASYAQVAGTSTSRKKNKQAKQQEAVQNHLQEKRPEAPNPLEHGQLRQRRRPLVPIKAARKVWNTYKFITASAVSHAVQKITNISAADLSIKRKYKSNGLVGGLWFVEKKLFLNS